MQRTRPVILTALAAVLAFIPLTHSVFWGSMAYTLIGGTAVGTVLIGTVENIGKLSGWSLRKRANPPMSFGDPMSVTILRRTLSSAINMVSGSTLASFCT